MKKQFFIISIFLCLFECAYSSKFDYGLYFNSHSVPGNRRTSLVLENNKSFPLRQEFTLQFSTSVRNEPIFGTLFDIRTDDKQTIDLAFTLDEDNKYYPALIINEKIYLLKKQVGPWESAFVSFTIFPDINKAQLIYDGKKLLVPLRLEKTDNIRIFFGASLLDRQTDTPPINIKDIKILEGKKLVRHWELKQHNDTLCYDLIKHIPAIARNPHWIINDHIEWQSIYTEKTKDAIQITFNPQKTLFYMVRKDKITIFDPLKNEQSIVAVKSGYPAMIYPNHLDYDTLSNCILSYSLENKTISRFSFNTQSWSLKEQNTKEPNYGNHSWAMNNPKSVAYAFGGYGFYHFKNELFRLDIKTGKVEQITDGSEISPRCSAASAIVGDNLYIFGGKGNTSGRQELAAYCYRDMYVMNLKTKKLHKLWEDSKEVNTEFVMAPTMYFQPEDSSFYAASLEKGGILIKVSIKEPRWTYVSKPINNSVTFKDMDYNLYYAPNSGKMFLVMDKRQNDLSHNIVIYSINYPLIEDSVITQFVPEPWYESRLFFFFVAGTVMLCGLFCYRKKLRDKKALAGKPAISLGVKKTTVENVQSEKVFFDRTKSSISLLGSFDVRDKDGKNVTFNFTPRLKSLLMLLLLYGEKDKEGISIKKVDEIIWSDKDEEAARNNRNVSLRKLRLLLENVGGLEIVNDNGFLRIGLPENVFCDYRTALVYIEKVRQSNGDDEELLYQAVELLLYGPLLTNTPEEWLDDFKAEYSSMSIDLLSNLLTIEQRIGNDELILKIADTLFRHDPLNEEALLAKCSVLFNNGKKSLAKSAYDKFCKEYHESLGENYQVSLSDILKPRE
ncbi:BTAD domain-containing putative transcriptional regulator [uncultured Bacteroides sp.]|uniref:Kelch repeat-containing protein n=1 Tax=uncultured Bacteroides sp. TaxID=162156 RepID=UPI002AA6404F|nr:BTAD domain-containing putative transcriptional regulator [uncultured Bacteroides sp.]